MFFLLGNFRALLVLKLKSGIGAAAGHIYEWNLLRPHLNFMIALMARTFKEGTAGDSCSL